MPSNAFHAVDACEIGTREQCAQAINEVPAWQFAAYFDRLAPHCPDRMEVEPTRRPCNGLNVEIGAPATRCKQRSPDGRGLAYLLSGGDAIAYGRCHKNACKRSNAMRQGQTKKRSVLAVRPRFSAATARTCYEYNNFDPASFTYVIPRSFNTKPAESAGVIKQRAV